MFSSGKKKKNHVSTWNALNNEICLAYKVGIREMLDVIDNSNCLHLHSILKFTESFPTSYRGCFPKLYKVKKQDNIIFSFDWYLFI